VAITVDSSQWTGQQDDTPLAVPVVWGEFESEAARDSALTRLREAGARDQGTPPEAGTGGVAPPQRAANEGQVPAPDERPKEADARQQRELHVGTAMAATSMAAAGIVIATGGTVLPAIAAALAAGAATAAVGEPVADAMTPQSGAKDRAVTPPPRIDGPVVGLQAPDGQTRERAERLLRDFGAKRVMVQERRSG
jgi:hypothetical protein